jgi:co-chaperonin GroES (HSP10)
MIKEAHNYIVVRPVFKESKGVIIIPESAQKRVSEFHGEVLSIGPDFPFKEVKQGDKILYRRDEGTRLETKNEELLALKPDWVLAILED